MRWVTTVVLPVPAPATINNGPPENSTAFFCSEFNFVKSMSIAKNVINQGNSDGRFVHPFLEAA